MMPKRKSCFCHSCGKRLEYSECPNRGTPPEDSRCKVLSGWLTVSHWRGMEAVDQYDFCSFSCLKKWVSAQVPRIPQAFFKAFGEE